ncbi:unnamed protein product, partial [Mesorhabditis belari]|uniref:Major facilitator superfamily (MFS) profile domain-containing protein n=1 Tax=Mesorhabditis belari TaxID=2138241 RepID=A0AAF3ERW3_9BILA
MGCILTCITNLFSAFTHTSINTAVDGVDDFLKESYRKRGTSLSDAQISLIRGVYNSVYYAGQVLGAVLGPHLPDKYGRKKAYIVTTIMMTISSVIQAVATLTIYPEIMILGRFVGAFFAPMNDTVMLLYCQETSTPKMRGVLNSLFSFGYSAMGLIGMIFGMKTILGNHLTILLMIPVPFGLIGSFYLFYLRETPKWLAIAKKDREAARKALEFYQGKKPENEKILDEYLDECKEEKEKKSLSNLFTVPHLRKALFLGNICLFLQLPYFSFLLSSTYLMNQIGVPSHLSAWGSTIISTALVLSNLVAIFLIKTFNRRSLLLTFSSLGYICVSLFAIAGHFPTLKYLAASGMIGFMLCFGFAIGPICFPITCELVPLQYRSSAICLAISMNSIFIVAANVAIEPLMETFGSLSTLFLFVLPCFLCLIYLYFHLPETKDYETHEIVQMIKEGKTSLRKNDSDKSSKKVVE